MSLMTTPAPWRRAVVTGGAGFLGSHLCERLLDAGVEVDCADNLLSGSMDNIAHLEGRQGFRFTRCDVSSGRAADELAGPYDLILHFACPASSRSPAAVSVSTRRLNRAREKPQAPSTGRPRPGRQARGERWRDGPARREDRRGGQWPALGEQTSGSSSGGV